MDKATFLGLLVGIGMILLGNLIEGGKIAQLIQPTALMIVLGGTVGATMIGFPMSTLIRAAKSIKSVFFEPANPVGAVIDEIVQYATVARKDGILALEPLAPKASDAFLSRALMMAVDGADSAAMRETLDASIHHVEQEGEDAAKVFEAGGGYAPTIGIIGAVLGLIQVMSHLSDINKVGEGIATAFVATIYGVGFANICFLPMGGKLKLRTRDVVAVMNIKLEGALAIQEGMNPKVIRERLSSMMPEHGSGHGDGKEAEKGA